MQAGEIFPHMEYRLGQKEMMKFVAEVMENGDCALIHGATGVGKTAPALAGTITGLDGGKLLCLTRTKGQRDIFVNEMERIQWVQEAQGMEKTAFAEIQSKKDLCPRKEAQNLSYHDFLAHCQNLREGGGCRHYANARRGSSPSQKLQVAIKEAYPVGEDKIIRETAKEYNICPYELAKMLLKRAQVGICSYHYLFNPFVAPHFLGWLDVEREMLKLIIDEAHNLPQTISNLYSWTLSTERSLEVARKEVQENKALFSAEEDILGFLNAFIDWIQEKARKTGATENSFQPQTISKEGLTALLDTWWGRIPEPERWINLGEDLLGSNGQWSGLAAVGRFLQHYTRVETDDKYVLSLTHKHYHGKVYDLLKITLIDPSEQASKEFSSVDAAILMSGSLRPFEYYQKILGFGKSVKKRVFGEKFHADRRKILYHSNVTSKYDKRDNAKNIARIRGAINAILQACPSKGVLIVFPSYTFMNKLLNNFEISRPTFRESRNERNIREKAIKQLKKHPNTVVMSVARGKLTEGVELRSDGKTLISSVNFVGLPFPRVDQITKHKERYFNQKYGKNKGFFLTVMAPMMRAVLQAGGRLIRDQNDHGVITLLDSRFKRYKRQFPKDWEHAKATFTNSNLQSEIQHFYKKQKKKDVHDT